MHARSAEQTEAFGMAVAMGLVAMLRVALVIGLVHALAPWGSTGRLLRSPRSAAQLRCLSLPSKAPISATPQQAGSDKAPENAANPRTGAHRESLNAGRSKGSPTSGRVHLKGEIAVKRSLSVLDSVLAAAQYVSPVEYKVLVQVEAGIVLWLLDKERSLPVLTKAIENLRRLAEEDRERSPKNPLTQKALVKLRLIALRKIAGASPDLVSLFREAVPEDNPDRAAKSNSTGEATAILAVAKDYLGRDLSFASRLAEQSLSTGFGDWTDFLVQLAKRDPSEAERLATLLITRMRDSSITSLAFDRIREFVLAPDRSADLRRYFFESLSARIIRDIRPDAEIRDLEDDLVLTRYMSQQAYGFPAFQAQVDALIPSLEDIFTARKLAIPGPPGTKIIDTSMLKSAAPSDTQEIADALPRVGTMADHLARDKEYEKLATKAALNANLSLAEEILSKIEDDNVRQEATVRVYGPLIRKALEDSNWPAAERLALNIRDPLARTLVFIRIARERAQKEEDRTALKEIYGDALLQLRREWSTDRVGKSYLLIARPLLSLDPNSCLDAVKSALQVLNRLDLADGLLGQSAVGSAASTWVSRSNLLISEDEQLDLTELLNGAFRDLGKRDLNAALDAADGLTHTGLRSLARLAACEGALEAATGAIGKPKQTGKASTQNLNQKPR